MVSGVSFKNPHQNNAAHQHKKIASMGMVFMLVVLLVVFIAYGIGLYAKSAAQKEQQKLEKNITQIQKEIDAKLAQPSRFVNALTITEKNIYQGQSAEVIFSTLESTMVPRVVLLTARYTKNPSAGDQHYTLALTGDFETYDVFAAQIDAWKNNPRFDNVRVGSVEPDDETGRLVFSVTMNMAPAAEGERPYDQPIRDETPPQETEILSQEGEAIAPAQENVDEQTGVEVVPPATEQTEA